MDSLLIKTLLAPLRKVNMQQYLVSVIVPIYNVETYIHKCVKSLIQQTYNNIEIILVDDGSVDDCSLIIDQLKKFDARIIVIHKLNAGVSSARNDGLKVASGDYIIFVDGDDFVDSEYVEYLVSLILDDEIKIAVDSEWYYNSKTEQVKTMTVKTLKSLEVIEHIYLGYIGVAVWNKIYSKAFLDQYGLRFNTDYWFAEGMLFNIMCLQYTRKVVVGNKRVYHTTENPLSATRSFKLASWICGLRSMEFQKNYWKKTSEDIQMSWEYHYRCYAESILRGLIQTSSYEENKKIFKKCKKVLKHQLRIPIQANIDIDRKINSLFMAIDPINYINGIYRFNQCNSIVSMYHLFLLKVFKKIPRKYVVCLIQRLEKKYKLNYKPFYLDRKLL